ncbi:MAG: PH domain-containing protein [Armatimonadetes bacterium]|nr:MAG: PH domain-containing protein [Armatimonadota bacterium]
MPWPEDALTEGESIVTSFRPHWKLLFVPALWGVGALVVFGLLAYWFDAGFWFKVAALVIVLVWFVVRPLVDWWFTRYVLTTERLITRRGLIAQRGIEIPLEGIANVNFSQSVFERILGAGDLLVESAGETGQSDFDNIPHPDTFQAILYKTREARSMDLAAGGGVKRPKDDGAEAIRKLAALRDEGLVSEEEYERKRKEILDGM